MIKKYGVLFSLLAIGHMVAMDLAPQEAMQERVDIKDKLYLYNKDTGDGIVIDENILSVLPVLEMLWNHRKDKTKRTIGISSEYPDLNTIAIIVGILKAYKTDTIGPLTSLRNQLDHFTLADLVSLCNAAIFLGINDTILNVFGNRIVEMATDSGYHQSDDYENLQELNDYFAKRFVLPDLMSFLVGHLNEKSVEPKILLSSGILSSSVACSPDGTKIVAGHGGIQNNLTVWDVATGKQINNLIGHPGAVSSVAFSPDSSKIVSGCLSDHNNLIVWDVVTGNQMCNLTHPKAKKAVYSVAFSPDGNTIVAGGEDCILLDISKPNDLSYRILISNLRTVTTVTFTPDGSRICMGGLSGYDDNLVIWDTPMENYLSLPSSHTKAILSIACSPNGTRMVTGGYGDQNNLIIWRGMRPLHVLRNLIGDPRGIKAVACSHDSNTFATVGLSDPKSIVMWNAATGEEMYTFARNVGSIAFCPDGKVVSGGHDLILWTKFKLSQQEFDALKNCNVAQLVWFYRLCLVMQNIYGTNLPDVALAKIRTFPQDVRNIFRKLGVVWAE
ncbi:MAG TPA: hypothetical protein VJJ26_01280 [Candidatus Babeliales bacterium]|nr:hypothetical protein [Candidatus Babeliales bacterium]